MRARVLLAFAGLVFACAAARAEDLVIFAAASLAGALDEAAKDCAASTGANAKISYAGSLALAKQIEQGAPADLFASADLDSMDYAQTRGLIRDDTRANLLANELVMVAAKEAAISQVALTRDGLAAALGNGRIATGEITSVPAGKYAKASLEKLGLWPLVEGHLAMSDNVRSALAFVTRGEAPLGIVYATDAKAEPGVKVVATFPSESHAPIVYPFAMTKAAKGDAPAKMLACLRGDKPRADFEKQGFTIVK